MHTHVPSLASFPVAPCNYYHQNYPQLPAGFWFGIPHPGQGWGFSLGKLLGLRFPKCHLVRPSAHCIINKLPIHFIDASTQNIPNTHPSLHSVSDWPFCGFHFGQSPWAILSHPILSLQRARQQGLEGGILVLPLRAPLKAKNKSYRALYL